ncbi:hypothetical protein E2562_024981 [Oryza meyeriana var. granulata]|uniref:Uncharacterized protein n=1 Tax=Oryza meyeriana var. granulata TaxID=110450 RepID=A0A6G1DPA0_9ORYZ|nr:hypothetical protein E2562_024981 [Oryza meyeriana var. granulata]
MQTDLLAILTSSGGRIRHPREGAAVGGDVASLPNPSHRRGRGVSLEPSGFGASGWKTWRRPAGGFNVRGKGWPSAGTWRLSGAVPFRAAQSNAQLPLHS